MPFNLFRFSSHSQVMLNAVCDLLFCPEFTVAASGGPGGKGGTSSSASSTSASAVRDEADDLQTLDSCEYIWAPGVGFARCLAIDANVREQSANSFLIHYLQQDGRQPPIRSEP